MTGRGPSSSVSTGIEGLDEILDGGLRPGAVYVVEGEAGTGKTTLALQFAMAGVDRGERVLYFSFSETVSELREIVRSHGWSTEGLDLRYVNVGNDVETGSPQTMIEPGELFLPRAAEIIRQAVEEMNPRRLVIDSLSDLRLVSQDLWLFRSQLVHLRETLSANGRVTLLLDSMTEFSRHLRTLASGILSLEQRSADFGPVRRQLTVLKMRARTYATGPHDFRILTGGLRVFSPLREATPARVDVEQNLLSSEIDSIDSLLGGGLDRGSSVLLMGPAGVGKSILATQYAAAAAQRGERARVYLFDEREHTFFRRAQGIGLDLEQLTREGAFDLLRVDPGEMSPGEFASRVRDDVEGEQTSVVIIDSLSGYLHAMPDTRHLQVQLHELLTYLSRRGVVGLLILGEHGPFGATPDKEIDLSYLADTVLLFRYFEYRGEMRRALSVFKKRSGNHERLIREIKIGEHGIVVGEPLRRFRGVLSGLPEYLDERLPETSST